LYNVASNSLGYLVGGAQDNGTQLVNFKGNAINGKLSKNAFSIYGGDGFDVEFSRFNPNTVFCCTYNGNIARSGNCGQSSSAFWDTRNDGTLAKDQKTDFNTTFSLWEKDDKNSRFYGAFGGVSFPTAVQGEIWACINATDFSKDPVWFCVAQNLGFGRIVEMDYSMDGDFLWIAKADGLYRVKGLNSANYSTSLYPLPKTIPAGISTDKITISGQSGRTVTSVNVDMADSTHVIVTFGGYGNTTYVYESKNATDAVPAWKNITGDLPLMPVYDALVDIDNPKNIILGTDLGIWMTNDGGTTWFESNTGMARVPVFEIRGYEWKPWEGMHVYIGTHGRGYFQSNSLLTNTKSVSSSKTALNVYPNPAMDKASLTFSALRNGFATVQLYDLSGKMVMSSKESISAGNNTIELQLSNLPAGYYLAQVVGDVNTKTVKILVK
jgi:hypothetical protein